MFIDLDKPEKYKLVASGRWDHIMKVVGNKAKRVEGYPERWEVTIFPSQAQLKAIGQLPEGAGRGRPSIPATNSGCDRPDYD